VSGSLPRLLGATRVPGDKGIAHRALMLAGMAGSESSISGLPDGLDVRSTRSCLEQVGVAFVGGARTVRVNPPAEWRPGHELDAGNSGTTARLLAGALAARRCSATIVGDPSLMRRPMERVAAPLRALGADVQATGGHLPLHVRGVGLHPSTWEARVPSAQVKTAFLLAATGAPGESAYREVTATRDHLERMLPLFGLRIERDDQGWLRLRGGRPTGGRVSVPGDPSSAAALLVGAAMLPGSDLVVEGVLLNPLRLGFAGVLARMGADVVVAPEPSLSTFESVGSIRVRGPAELAPVTVSAEEIPSLVDEVPLLAAAAAFAPGESRFEGLAELRVKESDRLQAVGDMLERLGVEHELEVDALALRGGATHRACALDARDDHRLAMVHAIVALRQPGCEVPVDPCVAVSWPGFHERLAALAG
jgi:3-phosphoshikimate 1-carboxyvinyltransferase